MATIGINASPVRLRVNAISTSNLTLSGAQTVDSVALTAGMLCGALGQSDNKNGVYMVQAGAWLPVNPGFGTGLEVYAIGGSANVNAIYGCDTTGAITWGTTTTAFTKKSSTGAVFDPASPGAIGGSTPAAITGTVITATTRMVSPTIGPNGTNQHTLPAVTSGTVFVSGASAIADDTLVLGDGTHRLSSLGTRAILSGLNALLFSSEQADGASSWQYRMQQSVAMVTGGSCILRLETAAQQALSGVGSLQFGCPSLGQADAMCDGEWVTASGTVTAGEVVVHSGAKLVATAGASAGLTTIAGVALTTGTNVPVLVAKRGRVYTNADAGITVGELLRTSGAVAGNVLNGGSAVGSIVGRACEATGATIAGKILVDLVLG